MSAATDQLTTLQEKQEYVHKKTELMSEVFRLSKTTDPKTKDLSRKSVLELLGVADEAEATAKVEAIQKDLDILVKDISQDRLSKIEEKNIARQQALKTPVELGSAIHPHDGLGERKTLGQMCVETGQFKSYRQNKAPTTIHAEIGLKTLFQTSAGFAPESVRSGLIVPDVTRPIQVTDLIPVFRTDQASFVYMEETTRTHSAAERAEGAAYAESAFVFTERTSTVRSIGDSIPVTDEQLEDESMVQSLLDQRLRFGLRQRLDLQILVGNGTPPNLEGINNATGVQTQALGTDDLITAFAKALTLIRFTGRATPTGGVFHPNDWQDYVLLKNANGDFLFGNPFSGPGPTSLLGVPVAISDAQTENTGLVGDFATFCRLDERRDIVILVGFTGSQFVEGKKTLRAELRVALTVTRSAAFCQITGI